MESEDAEEEIIPQHEPNCNMIEMDDYDDEGKIEDPMHQILLYL